MKKTYFTRETLLLRLRDSYDEKSWEEFVKYYRSYIYTVVLRTGLSYEDTQDVTQDILLKAWKGLPSFEYDSEQCKFRTWLSRVCRNCLRDCAKSKRAKLARLKVDDVADVEEFMGYSEAEIEKIAEVEWKNYIAEMAWERVSGEFSETVLQAFRLHAEECPVSDIATRLDIPENSVYVYRTRVRKALMKEIMRLDVQLG